MKHVLRITALLAAMLLPDGVVHAQSGPLTLGAGALEGAIHADARADSKYTVLVDLDTNTLHFRQGRRTLWSAPVGTGTGLRTKGVDEEWEFGTPRGTFQVQYKEEDPVWIAPDWYFVENDLPVPPRNDPKRRFPGGLGAAAVYFDQDLAIHGTDKPELLGQRVSHGCIRLANRYAKRLFHNVQIGTEVIIVGGENAPPPPAETQEAVIAYSKAVAAETEDRADPLREQWEEADAAGLLQELETQLWEVPPEESRWTEIAGLLLERGVEGDTAALAKLLAGADDLPSRRIEREYATFLADAYARAALPTLEAVSHFEPRQRQRVAEAIVGATLGLYGGDLHDPGVPWPTAQVPRFAAEPDGQVGWDALAGAEREYRDRWDANRG